MAKTVTWSSDVIYRQPYSLIKNSKIIKMFVVGEENNFSSIFIGSFGNGPLIER